MTHYNQDHNLERRQCIFDGCVKSFPPQFASRNHFGQFHTKVNKTKLKNEFLINPQQTGEDARPNDDSNEAIEDMDVEHEYEAENIDEDMDEEVVGEDAHDEEEVNIAKVFVALLKIFKYRYNLSGKCLFTQLSG